MSAMPTVEPKPAEALELPADAGDELPVPVAAAAPEGGAIGQASAFHDISSVRWKPNTAGSTGSTDSTNPEKKKPTGSRSIRVTAMTGKISFGSGKQNQKKNQQIIDQLRAWDKDGDGEITIEDIVEGARNLVETEERRSRMRRFLIISIVSGVLGCAAIFGITKGVVESSKETKAASGLLVNREGIVVGTAAAESKLGLADLTRLPIDVFKQVHRLTFSTDSGEYFTQVAFAGKTDHRLKITGQDGLKLECTVIGCEVKFPSGCTEQIWVNKTGSGRFLEAHEFPTIDMSFAGYDSARFQALIGKALGHPGDFALNSALGPLGDGVSCQEGVQVNLLAEACGLEASTNAVTNKDAACSETCKEAYNQIATLCGVAGLDSTEGGRRLAADESSVRTASETMRIVGQYRTSGGCSCDANGQEQQKPPQSWTSAVANGIGAKWRAAVPTQLTLTKDNRPFLTQHIQGLRLVDANDEPVPGVPAMVFTEDNSFVESNSTPDADFVTVYSVLPLAEKSALRVIISQFLAKVPQTLQTIKVGPTAVCVGPILEDGKCGSKAVGEGHLKFSIFVEAIGAKYKLPQGTAKLNVILNLAQTSDANIVTVPVTTADGKASLDKILLERGDGSSLWAYKFDQTFNVDNVKTSDKVVVVPTRALKGLEGGPRDLHVAVSLSVGGAGGALEAAGSFLMYDPETFSGSEKMYKDQIDSDGLVIDELAIAVGAIVYAKFDNSAATASASASKLKWMLENSPILKAGGWDYVHFPADHPCRNDGVHLDFWGVAAGSLCVAGGLLGGGKFGVLQGVLNGQKVGLISFAGTDDLRDVLHDACAASENHIYTFPDGTEVALGFWKSYLALRPLYARVLQDLKDAGVQQILISGHSLGGAIASIATYELYTSYELAGGFFMNKHLRTVTMGEPAPWKYPHLPFSDVDWQWWTLSWKVTPWPGMEHKYHRYINSVRQKSVQCAIWENIFGTGWGTADLLNYKCEIHDWDAVAGLSTLGGKGFHATRSTYWTGFDGQATNPMEAVNVYKETNVNTEFNRNWQSLNMEKLPNWLQSFLFMLSCNAPIRRLEPAPVAVAALAAPALVTPRRLGLMERFSLHHAGVYFYWVSRAVCEEKGRDNCDCGVFCMSWGMINDDMGAMCLMPGYNVCDLAPGGAKDYFCSDSMHRADKCGCVDRLPLVNGQKVQPKCS